MRVFKLARYVGLLYACLAMPTYADLSTQVIATGLETPWSLAFLPNGDMLVTERPGRLRLVDQEGTLSPPIKGLPGLYARGQGGLLDVVLDKDFSKNRTLYLSYSEPDHNNPSKAGTAVARATLTQGALSDWQVIFRQRPKVNARNHFGSRLVLMPNNVLFITLGERFNFSEQAQTLDNHMGKVVRIHTDGRIPSDNPWVTTEGALPDIWSYGHRNPQGAAAHPTTGELWIHEHGPRGGDEINIPLAGKNYGWPKASYGSHYSFIPIKDEHAARGFEEPIHYWTPSIAPSGMAFYTGPYADWQGNLFVGALAGKHLARLVLDEQTVTKEEKLLTDQGWRIRDVKQSPSGDLYILTDDPKASLVKLQPDTP